MNNRIEIPWNPIKFSTSPTTGFQWPPQALFQLLHRQRQQLLLEARLRVLAAQVALRRPKRRDLYGDILGISWGYTYMLIYVLYMYYILYYIYIYCIHMCIYIYILYTHMCDWAMDLGVPYIAKSHGFKMGIQPTRLERWWITWLIHVHHASKRKSERTECVWKFICCYIPQLAIVFGRESHDQVDAPRALLGWQHPSSPWTSHEHQTSGCELVP